MDEKKKNYQENIAPLMVVVGFIGMFLSLFLVSLLGFASMVLLGISIVLIVFGLILLMIEKKSDEDAYIANIRMFQEEYDAYVNKLGYVRRSDTQATLIETDEYNFTRNIPHYLWISDNNLNMFPMSTYYKQNETSSMCKPDVSELKLKTVPIDSILYFEEVGELRKYTTVSGGGTSLKGALIGYAIAEDIGAIIGSREPITTNIISEDDRRIELIYKNQQNQIENLEFKHDAYMALKELIPLKELRKIIGLNSTRKVNDTRNDKIQKKNTKEKLKQLKEMKEEGLITNEEFLEQRKKILDSF